jgi:hypothetical protein
MSKPRTGAHDALRAVVAAPSDVEAVVALGRIKAIAAHYRDESKVSLRSSMQAIYETADKAYDPDDLRGYRVAAPSITDDPEYFPSTEYERGYADGRVAAPSDGLREAVESITRTTQRPAGRGPYVEHEVDEGHAPGEPCRFCDALAATEQPETGREYCVICGSDAHHGDEHNDAIRYAHPEVEA